MNPPAAPRPCPTCNGAKTVTHTKGGKTVYLPCPACGGSGTKSIVHK